MTKIIEKQNIPEEWEDVQVADVMEINPEQINPINSPDDFFQYIDIASVKDFRIHNVKLVTGLQAPGRARRVVRADDVIVSNVRPNLKGICRVPKYNTNTLCSTGFTVARPKAIDEYYAYQVLVHDSFTSYLIDKTTGSNYPAVNSNDIAGYRFPLPKSKKEQQKIAKVLGAVDEEIEKTKEVIKATEKLKKGLMQQLFTRGIGHTKFKQTELGEIPESWELRKLEDVAEFSNGKAHEKLINSDGEYIVVNSKFISSDGKVKKFTKTPLSLLKVGDVAMVMSDVPNGKALAKCLYVDENEKYTLNQRICSLRTKKILNSEFLFYVLNRNKNLLKHDDGVGQTNLRKDEVLNCPFQLPPITEQERIVEILKVVDKKISVNKKLLAKQTELKKGLMQDLLSGVKRVKI